MPDPKRTVRVSADVSVSALLNQAPSARWTFIYAPGAGSNINDAFGTTLARDLPERGISVARFQFPYMEAGRRGPDRPPVLEATWHAAIDALRPGDGSRLVVGGRSMGGRIASMAVASGAAVDAVALFAYPLHPPGKPERLRVEHLTDVRVPILFCSGTRDAFASPEELRAAAAQVERSHVHLLDGADHGFAVAKSSGRTKDDVAREAIAAMLQWLGDI